MGCPLLPVWLQARAWPRHSSLGIQLPALTPARHPRAFPILVGAMIHPWPFPDTQCWVLGAAIPALQGRAWRCSIAFTHCPGRQHRLEERLLLSGKFSEALQALLDWLYRAEPQLSEDVPVGGDRDLVSDLMDKHKVGVPIPIPVLFPAHIPVPFCSYPHVPILVPIPSPF